jgi:nuclear GTP-binding protein
VCKAAPIPGETKTWKYITLFKRIFLIDCPGVVYGGSDHTVNNELESVLKGVVRIDNLEEPWQYIEGVLQRIKPEYIASTYGISSWKSSEDFLEQFARASGKLLKGAEPDINTAARMVLNDWQRGRIPFFSAPPFEDNLPTHSQRRAQDREEEKLQVEQMFNKINVKPKFTYGDMQQPAQMGKTQSEEKEGQNVVDYDQQYANLEGEEVDTEQAEKLLNISSGENYGEEREEEEGEGEDYEDEEGALEAAPETENNSENEYSADEVKHSEEEEGSTQQKNININSVSNKQQANTASMNSDGSVRSRKSKNRSKKRAKQALTKKRKFGK